MDNNKELNRWALEAIRDTAEAARVEDSRLASEEQRQLRDAAKDLATGKGYFMGTALQLAESYPATAGAMEDTAGAGDVQIWGIFAHDMEDGRKHLFPIAYVSIPPVNF